MTGNTPLKLISMSEINAEEVQWLWYPYIPLGKLTIIQGDPGEGKTSFILAVIAALTRGDPLPECERAAEPMNVIYQTAEDGLADTIKPRLESAGADCTRVLDIDDGKRELTLCDARLEEAIRSAGVFASGFGGMGGSKFKYHSRCSSLNSSGFLILPYFFGFSK